MQSLIGFGAQRMIYVNGFRLHLLQMTNLQKKARPRPGNI
jgi:hypothetical protein